MAGRRIATRASYKGVSYASKTERDYASRLDAMRIEGLVRWWQRAGPVYLGSPVHKYTPDFFVVYSSGKMAFIDTKGVEDREFKKHLRGWELFGPCRLVVVKRNGKSWSSSRVVEGENRHWSLGEPAASPVGDRQDEGAAEARGP